MDESHEAKLIGEEDDGGGSGKGGGALLSCLGPNVSLNGISRPRPVAEAAEATGRQGRHYRRRQALR